MSDGLAITIAVVLLALNAFFVGAEFALISARRTQIEPRAAAGSRAARTTLRAMENVSLMMAGAQLGITICSLGLGAIGEPAVAHLIEPAFESVGLPDDLLHPIAFVLAMTIVVYLHVVLGEMVPKNIALAGPERSAILLGPPLMAIVTALRPLIIGLNALANGILWLLKVPRTDEVSSTFTHAEVGGLVAESLREGLIDSDEYDLLAGALGFTERTVDSVLLPLDDLATVRTISRLSEVEELCRETGFSRFPVTDADRALVGYVHIKDVLETDPRRPDRSVGETRVRGLATVHASDRLHEALSTMRASGAHLARVVDAESVVLGVVALEDVLEELVGEILDAAQHARPHDEPEDR